MRNGKVARVVCHKLDRLGRSLTHLALTVDEMNRLQIPLICCSQGIDTSEGSPSGKLQLAVLAAVAEFERSIIRERVRAGLAAARARGVRLGRPALRANQRQDVLRLRAEGHGTSGDRAAAGNAIFERVQGAEDSGDSRVTGQVRPGSGAL